MWLGRLSAYTIIEVEVRRLPPPAKHTYGAVRSLASAAPRIVPYATSVALIGATATLTAFLHLTHTRSALFLVVSAR